MSTLKIIRYGAWASISALAIVVGVIMLSPRPATDQATGGSIGGPFTLATHEGKVMDSRSLAGRPYAVFFGFTQCPDICPTTMFELSQALRELGEPARGFKAYFITVDPERDTQDLLKSYVSAFEPFIVGLIPTAEQLPAVARQFAAYYKRVPTGAGYTMDHTASVYLFDARGAFAGTLNHQESQEVMRQKLQRLLGIR
jgi:protein SCO1/2